MANFNGAGKESQGEPSAVGQTGNVSRSSSMTGSAAKVFREFKWGLITLFLLMVVVIGLVYDGGRKKKTDADKSVKVAEATQDLNLDSDPNLPPGGIDPSQPTGAPQANVNTQPNTQPNTTTQADMGMGGDSVPPVVPMPGPVSPAAPTHEHMPEHSPLPTTHDLGMPHGNSSLPETHESTGHHHVETVDNHPTPPAASEKTYTVKSGDTLTHIAGEMMPGNKNGVKLLLEANKDVLPNPNKLKVNMTLKIPAATASAEPRKPKTADIVEKATLDTGKPEKETKEAKAKEPASKDDYVVQNGDTLERIARKLFNDGKRWREIYEWNRDQIPDAGRLRVGQTLRIKTLSSTKTSTSAARAEAEPNDVKESKSKPEKAEKKVANAEPSTEEPHVETMSDRVLLNDLP